MDTRTLYLPLFSKGVPYTYLGIAFKNSIFNQRFARRTPYLPSGVPYTYRKTRYPVPVLFNGTELDRPHAMDSGLEFANTEIGSVSLVGFDKPALHNGAYVMYLQGLPIYKSSSYASYGSAGSGSTQVQKMQQSAQQHQDQTYFGSEEMKGHAEQYLSQLQAVSQASETFSQTASMQDSSGKSLSMSYQDLARRLNNSGAIVDINLANQSIAESMGAEAYQKLSDDAQYEINRSSASGIFGGDRDALAGFLKLNQSDPIKAAEIVNKALMPSSSESGANITPTQFQNDQNSIKDIMGDQSADDIKSLAEDWNEGQDSGTDGDGKSANAGKGATIEKPELTGGHQSKRGKNDSEPEINDGDHKSAMKHQTPHAPEHLAHGAKTSHTAEPKQASIDHAGGNKHGSGHTSDLKQAAKQIKPVSLAGEGDSHRAEIDSALKGGSLGKADDIRQKIESGGKIDNRKDMSEMAGRAFRNEGSLLYDSTVTPVANTAKSAISGLREGIETAEDYINNAVSGALPDPGGKQPIQPTNATDNDLPPIPKK